MDFEDDWNLSAEDLDSLEKDALKKIEERKSSSATASASSSQRSPPKNPSSRDFQQPLPERTLETQNRKAEAYSPAVFPASEPLTETLNETTKDFPKLSVKLFLHASGNIAAKFQYHPLLVEACRKIPKASWHGKERLWMFPISSLAPAEKFLNEMDGANVEVQKLDPLVQSAISAASAISDLQELYNRIPNFIEAKLLPFQRDGVRFMLQRGGRALLADEMGLGKTLQALAFSICVRDSWPVLVLTPSSLRLHWASMIHQWLNICSADIVTVIADESHFLKNAQAKRTNASLPVLKKAQYVILLTGTPALSRPIELFKQLEALYPDVYKNVHEYGNRYCRGGVFGLYQGASNHDELHNLIKATVMIRRLKRDVLTELPVKRRQQVFLNLDEKDMKQIRALFLELEVVKGNIKVSKSEEEIESLKITQKNLINRIYHDSAEAKIPAVIDYLGIVIEAGCKFLIFAHHQPMLIAIHQFLQKKKVACIRIDGNTPQSARQALVTQFQEKDEIKAAVLSIKAAGVGLTLTAASTVIFAELSWNPGDIIQAEDRAHRIGQVSSVNIYYLLANDTVDDIIWDVVQNKIGNLGQMLDGQDNMLEVSVSETSSSPSKQATLDSFLKRCHSPTDSKMGMTGYPKSKNPRS